MSEKLNPLKKLVRGLKDNFGDFLTGEEGESYANCTVGELMALAEGSEDPNVREAAKKELLRREK
jgi:hypothetical protein